MRNDIHEENHAQWNDDRRRSATNRIKHPVTEVHTVHLVPITHRQSPLPVFVFGDGYPYLYSLLFRKQAFCTIFVVFIPQTTLL